MNDQDLQARAVSAAAALRVLGEHVTPDLRMRAQATAALVGQKPRTLRNWRSDRKGPPWVMRGGQPWYRVIEVVRWLDSEERPISLDEAE